MFQVPVNLTLDEAPVMELVLAACRALMEVRPEKGRRTVSICGLGPSGLVLVQYARALGYEHIIGWDLYETRRNLALLLGADEVYDPAWMTDGQLQDIPERDVYKRQMRRSSARLTAFSVQKITGEHREKGQGI